MTALPKIAADDCIVSTKVGRHLAPALRAEVKGRGLIRAEARIPLQPADAAAGRTS